MKFPLLTTFIILFFTIIISNCKKEETPVPNQVKPPKTSENINTTSGTDFSNGNTVSGTNTGISSGAIPSSNPTTTSGNSQNTSNTTSGNNTNPTTSSGTNTNNPPPTTTTPSAPISTSYALDIAPILLNRGCTGCHGYTFATAKAEAGPSTNVRSILNRINRTQGSTGFMPRNGTKLPQSEINKIQEWFDSGMNP